ADAETLYPAAAGGSNAPNVIQAAPAFRSAAEVEEKTNGLLDNGRFARSGRTSLIDGEVFASLRACIESGLPPWLVAPDLVTDAYCRMDRPAALLQAV